MSDCCRCAEVYARTSLPKLANCDECEKKIWLLTQEESAEIRKRAVPVLTPSPKPTIWLTPEEVEAWKAAKGELPSPYAFGIKIEPPRSPGDGAWPVLMPAMPLTKREYWEGIGELSEPWPGRSREDEIMDTIRDIGRS